MCANAQVSKPVSVGYNTAQSSGTFNILTFAPKEGCNMRQTKIQFIPLFLVIKHEQHGCAMQNNQALINR